MKIVLSSGHGSKVRGASGYIDEVDEARNVVNRVATYLNHVNVSVKVFHDDQSHSQNENLSRICSFHNTQGAHDLDVSVHFNAYETTGAPMGTECLYCTQEELSKKVATEIAKVSGLKNRGPKYRDDLYFLNNTKEPAILIEVCFVDSQADVNLYHEFFELICVAIAEAVSGISQPPIEPEPPEPEEGVWRVQGKCSSFGGPDDDGVGRTEGLAFISSIDQAPHLFLPYQPAGTTGLARRLNPYVHYVACRWNYDVVSKSELLHRVARVRAVDSGYELKAFPADWGPHENTGRVADLSPTLLDDLGLKTDDEVEVTLV